MFKKILFLCTLLIPPLVRAYSQDSLVSDSTVLFIKENFDTTTRLWPLINDADNQFIITQGEYILKRFNKSIPYAILINQKEPLREASIKANLKLLNVSKDPNYQTIGIIFMVQRTGKDAYIFEINSKKQYRLKHYNNGYYNFITGDNKSQGWVKSDVIKDIGEYNLLEAKADRENYSLFINGTYILSFFNNYKNGNMGLIIGPSTTANADYFYVYVPPNVLSEIKFASENEHLALAEKKIKDMEKIINKQNSMIDSLSTVISIQETTITDLKLFGALPSDTLIVKQYKTLQKYSDSLRLELKKFEKLTLTSDDSLVKVDSLQRILEELRTDLQIQKDINNQLYKEIIQIRAKNDSLIRELDLFKDKVITPKEDKTLLANQFFQQGKNKESVQDYNGAISDYTKAIELEPHFIEAYYYRGNLKKKQGDYAGAIGDFTRLIEINPNDANPYVLRANVKYSQHDYDGVIADLTKALEIDSLNTEAYYLRAKAYGKKGDYDSAIVDNTKFIKLDPNNPIAYFNMACYLSLQNKQKEALEYLEKSLQMGFFIGYAEQDADLNNIRNLPEYQNIIQKYKLIADTAKAATGHSFDISSKRISPAEYFKSGKDKELAGDYKGAIDDYTKAIELDTAYIEAYYCRGNLRQKQGDYAGAISDFSVLIKFQPHDPNPYIHRGTAKDAQKNYDEAIADFNKAVEIDRKNIEAYYLRSKTFYKKGDYDSAIDDCHRILQFDEKNNIAYYNLACLYSLQNKPTEALHYLEKAIQHGFIYLGFIEQEKDFNNIKNLPEFQELLKKYQLKKE